MWQIEHFYLFYIKNRFNEQTTTNIVQNILGVSHNSTIWFIPVILEPGNLYLEHSQHACNEIAGASIFVEF